MAFAVLSDHLRSQPAPHVFPGERAEFICINNSLDRHISDLNALRYTLHSRSSQLHNLLSPIHTLPTEVLSYIFQLLPDVNSGISFPCYQKCLRQALVLSFVSPHFCHVALNTPDLWNKIPLYIAEGIPIGKVLSLLQHCIVRASNVTICVADRYSYDGEGDLRSAIEILFNSDTTRKVKALKLYGSNHVSLWLSKINGSSFPIIETLIIQYNRSKRLPAFDFGTLNTMSQLSIYGPLLDLPIILPPSVQYLSFFENRVSEKMFVSLLYQCPNLVECSAKIQNELHGPPFTKPLILDHLTRLNTDTMNAFAMSSSLQHLQLPSLESLCLSHLNRSCSLEIVLFCRNVSATLTTLTITTLSPTLDYDDLYQLWRSTFPKLRVLNFNSVHLEPLLSTIRALSPLESEYNHPMPLHLPALKSITLSLSSAEVEPRILLDLLKNWWIDDALHLHFKLRSNLFIGGWVPASEEELRLIPASRFINIKWAGNKIQSSRVVSSSLRRVIE